MNTTEFIRKTSPAGRGLNGDNGDNYNNRLKENRILNDDGSILRYLTFPALDELDIITHAITTRQGGVSSGCYESMNLSYTRGDDPKCVDENYQRMMKTMGVTMDRVVTADQKHTNTVRVVSEEDAGKGVTRELDYSFVDGIVTNERGITIALFASDCVPLFFVDPVRRAIGLSHSGWRGTIGRIGRVTVETMSGEFGTDPKDLICYIGPSICRSCYEVGREVAEEFVKEFPEHEKEIVFQSVPEPERDIEAEKKDKYHLDLWRANRIILEDEGVLPGNIYVTDICTKCNPGLLFSHRACGESRGNNTCLLMLK